MKMPEPVGYLSQYNLTMLEQGYPQTIVMLKGAKRDLPLYSKQALIDLLEAAINSHSPDDIAMDYINKLIDMKETL